VINGLVVIGCSRRKTPSLKPVPALDLYQGACFPQLRARLTPELRDRVRILSAKHGLITVDQRLYPYDQRLTLRRACDLRRREAGTVAEALEGVDEVLVVAERRYLRVVLRPIRTHPGTPRLRWVADAAWDDVSAVLDSWSWP
jgi:hypothetical protein